jgi:DNA replication protein DnaC
VNDFYKMLTNVYLRHVAQVQREYRDDPNTRTALASVARWMDGGKPWLLLMGNVGTGKTITLRSLLSTLLALEIHDKILGCGDEVPGVLMNSAQEIAKYDGDRALSTFRAKVLLIDDFGVEPGVVKSYGNATTNVTDLLYYRYERRTPTVITTNLTLPEIGERYGERIADRLREVADVVVFNFQSFRRI